MKYIETTNIAVADIDDTNRLRPLDPRWVTALAESIAKIGQKEPIEVVAQKKGKPYRLIAGGHRLAGCREAGLAVVRAEVKEPESGNPDLECRLHEIDENLIRNELNPLDRAVFLGERQKIHEAMYPAAKRGGKNQHTAEPLNEIVSFSKSTAEKIDLGERTIQRATHIYKHLAPEIRSRIAGTPLAQKEGELYQLTRYGPDDQVKILDMCLRVDDPVPSVKVAGDIVDGHVTKASSQAEAQYEKLYDAWKRCTSKKPRKHFLENLVEMGVIPSFNEAQI